MSPRDGPWLVAVFWILAAIPAPALAQAKTRETLLPPRVDPAPRMSYLDNGTIKLGMDLAQGGAVTYLSPSGKDTNVVNSYDFGRQIQMSYYSGPVPYLVGAKKPMKQWWHIGWNPVQAGDDYRHPSQVLQHTNDGKTLYVRCVPMQWPLDNEPAECTYECWIRLDGATARVKCRLTNERGDRTQYPARTQEMPAVYTNGPYHRLMTYTGSRPFQNEPLTQITRPKDHQGPWMHWLATENWAAHVDDQGWGLGVWHPGIYRFSGGFAGTPGQGGPRDAATGYLAPNRQEILDANLRHEYEYILILGTLEAIRAHVAHSARKPAPPAYHFKSERQGWYYVNAVDTGWPIAGELKVLLEKEDPQMLAPATFFAAADAPVCRIEAALRTAETTAQLFWETLEKPGFHAPSSVLLPISGDGKFRIYEVNLAGSKSYHGHVTGVRLDPVPAGHPGDWMRIKSITFGS